MLALGIFFSGLLGCGPSGSLESDSTNGSDGEPGQTPTTLPQPTFVHPDFRLTQQELESILDRLHEQEPRALTDGVRAKILARPRTFLDQVNTLFTYPDETFLLADKEHLLPEGYVPSDLVRLEDYQAPDLQSPGLVLNRQGLELRQIILPDLLAMAEAAQGEGIVLDLSSAYRSYEYQRGLFQTWVESLGLEEAQRVSARAGTSQHQLGTTIDFGSITLEFATHPAGRWLAARAWDFGFSLSYPEGQESLTGYAFEPWHFRWIGKESTKIEQELFEGSQFRFLLFWNLVKDDLYQVWQN
ncbi:MAG: M15 family metallopeptidase [Spirochaetales bacterium]|nr:M15 family metallopeptidase [Spirochaetales bacterium]